MSKQEDFYTKLRASLKETTTFPSEYLYKFIIPTEKEKQIQLENMFNFVGAVIKSKKSKNGKYTSISIRFVAKSADEIISKYKEVSAIEGVISL